MGVTQKLLGWEKPFSLAVSDWLWERKGELPAILLVLPTAQSGRRLRQLLAERGAILAPRVVTSGALMRPDHCAPKSVEILAWVEVLEAVGDWSRYEAVFPISPRDEESPGWAMGLAKSLAGARASLQENGLLLSSAAHKMGDSVEAERWRSLADLESQVEKRLKDWNLASKSAQLAKGVVTLPPGIDHLVIAGVLDLPPVIARSLEKTDLKLTVLLPGDQEDDFDAWGRPKTSWLDAEIAWPQSGSVELTGDPRQQAELACRCIAEHGHPSNEVSLGTGDEEVSDELVSTFKHAGWAIHNPGSTRPSPIAGWLSCWRRFLLNDRVAEVIDLLAFTQSGAIAKGRRALRTNALSQLRDQWMVRTADDITRARKLIERDLSQTSSETKKNRLNFQKEAADLAGETMNHFAESRARFLGRDFHAAMRSLLPLIDPEETSGIAEWLDETASVAREVKRTPGFWLELLLGSLGSEALEPPLDRVLDVQGWLELLHEPAKHLVICGMNEGMIPSCASSDPWLPESTRVRLGLAHDASRAARDAFLLQALIKMREQGGRVDLIVGKSALNGDILTPSRLLLAAKGEELARRVKLLFAEVEPADSGLAWTLEGRWKWQPPTVEPKERMSVTAIAKYLDCPFRYYLERVVGMNQPEPERAEWNHRDFGNIMHEVLERWGLDETARDFNKTEAIEDWVHRALDEVVAERFGSVLPLAVRIQTEAMRQRLSWFARVQSAERVDGWQVIEVEKDFSLQIDGVTLTGQIDRIDRHEDGRIRVLDYKTSKDAKDVLKEHVRPIPKETPAHLENIPEVMTPDGKLWKNVQVPFYSAVLDRVDEAGFFALGETETEVKLSLWEDFGDTEKQSAMACARWVIGQVKQKVFWPPSDKPTFDDYGNLAYGRLLEDAIAWKGGEA